MERAGKTRKKVNKEIQLDEEKLRTLTDEEKSDAAGGMKAGTGASVSQFGGCTTWNNSDCGACDTRPL